MGHIYVKVNLVGSLRKRPLPSIPNDIETNHDRECKVRLYKINIRQNANQIVTKHVTYGRRFQQPPGLRRTFHQWATKPKPRTD